MRHPLKHPYLNHEVCVRRLHDWYTRNGTLIVAFDFDNTVYDFHNKGHDYSEVITLLKKAKRVGCYLIVFTGNPDMQLVRDFLQEKDIPYDVINEHTPFLDDKSKSARKIYYNVLLDDAAGLESAYRYLDSFLDSVLQQPTFS